VNRGLSGALQAVWRFVLRVARYSGPLLRDALVWLWRILLDVAGGLPFAWRWWKARRQPDTVSAFEAWRASLRERRAARWAPWRTLPPARRATVGLAAVLLVLSAAWLIRARSSVPSPGTPATAADLSPPPIAGPEPSATPAFDVSAAAARVRAEIERAPSGQWVFLSEGPVLAPGPSGSWDGFRVASPVVLPEDEHRYRMWYRGCRLHGREQGCAIGHATSSDGLEWKQDESPVIVPSEGADEFDLGGIAVVRANGTYFLWYSVAADYFSKRPTSPLYLATSADGLRWQDQGRVFAAAEQLPRFVEPSAVYDGQQFHLWFVDSMLVFEGAEKNEPPDGPFLRHLTSADGRTWQDAGQFPLGPIDRGRVRVSVTRENDGSYRAFYFGRLPGGTAAAVGWLLSADGNDWRLASTMPVDGPSLGDDVQGAPTATGLRDATGVRVWFVTERSGGRQEIRAAFYKE
jgi:hypothetical protein